MNTADLAVAHHRPHGGRHRHHMLGAAPPQPPRDFGHAHSMAQAQHLHEPPRTVALQGAVDDDVDSAEPGGGGQLHSKPTITAADDTAVTHHDEPLAIQGNGWGSYKNVQQEDDWLEDVFFGAYAPARVARGSTFRVSVWAFLAKQVSQHPSLFTHGRTLTVACVHRPQRYGRLLARKVTRGVALERCRSPSPGALWSRLFWSCPRMPLKQCSPQWRVRRHRMP